MAQHDHETLAEQYIPSSSEQVRDQVALDEATGGREGGTLEGVPVVVLTMTGATSGKIRKTPVMRIEHDGTYLAVASNGGAPSHPAWYHNLITHPDVRLQDGAQVHSLRAREVLGQEEAGAWKVVESRWPHFPEYRTKAGREIPILLLEPANPRPEVSTDNRHRPHLGDHP
jgi:deazaflavin-dependent oxidoreductase (nitroreductase family)